MKYLFLTLIFLFSNLINAQNIIGESVQSTATERNNARLIVEDSNGYLHVVYYNNGIYYSFSDDNGITWTDSVLIDESGRNPSIAINSNNIIHLVYKHGGTNAYDIVHRTYDQGIWSEFDYVYHDANMISPVSRPVIAVDFENNLHCVWQRAGYSSTPNSEIWYNKYVTGTNWETPINISNTYGASEYPTLTIDNDNNIFAFWKDSGEDINNDKMVLLRKYTVGSGWDADYTNISNTTGNGSYATMDPCAVSDINGNIHLVWKDSQSGNREIFYKKCTDGIWDDDFTNISNTAEASAHPTISTDTYENLYVFWEEKFNGIHYDIAHKKYDKNLEIWSDITNISNTENDDSKYPNCPNKISNLTSVIWTEGDASPFSIMYYGELFPANINKLPDNLFSVNIYPNPFSQSTVINYKILVSGKVILKIYNIHGQEIRTLENINLPAGNHSAVWNGKDNFGKDVGSGVYICRLQIKNSILRKKIIFQ